MSWRLPIEDVVACPRPDLPPDSSLCEELISIWLTTRQTGLWPGDLQSSISLLNNIFIGTDLNPHPFQNIRSLE